MDENNIKRLDELTDLLRDSIKLCKEDRKLAKDNYDALRSQLDNIIDSGMESSEDGRIEQETNRALKLVFESGTRMESVINTITKILVAQLNAESRERVAANIFGNNGGFNPKQIVNKAIDLRGLLDEPD